MGSNVLELFYLVLVRYIRMYQISSWSTMNLNPSVGLLVTLMSSPPSTAHVIIRPSAVRSCLSIHVASHRKAFHICLVGVRICCRCVPGRFPSTSCTHLEATVIQDNIDVLIIIIAYIIVVGSPPPPLSVVMFGDDKKGPDVVGILPEAQDFDV
jgi:hypothetical protein